MSSVVRFAIDAGSSRTRLYLPNATDLRTEFTSINLAAVSEQDAQAELIHCFNTVASQTLGQPVSGWIASAAVSATQVVTECKRVMRAAAETGLRGQIVISNDIVPLLFAPPLAGKGIAGILGTGSNFFGGNGADQIAQVGGQEYLASDEGSAFELGVRALRAAVHAVDGQGQTTLLTELIRQNYGNQPGPVSRQFAQIPFPKTQVAAVAPLLSQAWRAGDSVASQIVTTVADEVAQAIKTLWRRLGLIEGSSVVLTGGVAVNFPEFVQQISQILLSDGFSASVTVCPEVAPLALVALQYAYSEGQSLFERSYLNKYCWQVVAS